jgi:hypothetical protein
VFQSHCNSENIIELPRLTEFAVANGLTPEQAKVWMFHELNASTKFSNLLLPFFAIRLYASRLTCIRRASSSCPISALSSFVDFFQFLKRCFESYFFEKKFSGAKSESAFHLLCMFRLKWKKLQLKRPWNPTLRNSPPNGNAF